MVGKYLRPWIYTPLNNDEIDAAYFGHSHREIATGGVLGKLIETTSTPSTPLW